MSALRAAARRLSTKPVLRSTLCWGDTSAAWDWAARTLTLSDGATTVLAENVDGFAELWRRNQLVLRKHGVAFDWSHKACLLYTSPSPRDAHESRMPSSA